VIRFAAAAAAWAAVAWLCGTWLGRDIGWALFTVGLLAVMALWRRQMMQVSDWARNVADPPPPLGGAWGDILAPIYRTLRGNRHDMDQLARQVRGIMQAAEALPDGAMTLDDSLRMTWCNRTASRHLGLDPATDRGHSIFNIVRAPEFARYAKQAQWDHPMSLRVARDGRDTTLLIQLIPYGLNRFLMVTRDVTQLERLETTRKDFVANVSHELRTPLTVLSGFLETLQDMPPDTLPKEQHEHYLGLMREQAGRMQAIVEDLLTLSTLESSPPGDGSPVDMAGLIATALAQAQALSGGKHVIGQHVEPGLSVLGNAHELSSAVANLLTNAVRYTPPGGRIDVTWARSPDGGARYTVQDTGIGIAAHHIPRLTERFYRVDRGRSRATGGTGLGLAITKHIAMRHQASLDIESRVNAGSTFTLAFPAARLVAGNNPASDKEI
jgi:two-component system phosphate regulon sensor histidine kinase PhoR